LKTRPKQALGSLLLAIVFLGFANKKGEGIGVVSLVVRLGVLVKCTWLMPHNTALMPQIYQHQTSLITFSCYQNVL